MSQSNASSHSQKVVGSPNNFWLWSPESGWDLTHPQTHQAPLIQPRLVLDCEISNVTVEPLKTALVVIDMQNYSMHRALCDYPAGHAVFEAQDTLLRHAIPAARSANIQVVWLNWGLTDEDLLHITPEAMRVFEWRANCEDDDYGLASRPKAAGSTYNMIHCGETHEGGGPGADLGQVLLADGTTSINAGRGLMRDTWNAELHGPLLSAYEEGQACARPDVLVHKNRNSGLYDSYCDFAQYLKKSGIRTLLFTGMKTDHCVMATLKDAHSRGFDTIMLKDACATTSPSFTQLSAEFNACINWGFSSTCRALAAAAAALATEAARTSAAD